MATVVIQRRPHTNGVSYAVRYRDPVTGKRCHYKTFQKKKDADRARNELRSMLDTGETPDLAPSFRPMTFSAVARELEVDWQYRNSVREISDKTYYEYVTRIRQLERKFGRRRLCEVTEQELKQFLMDESLRLSTVTANHHLKVLKQLMRKASELGALKKDPTAGLRKLSEKAHERNRFLLPHEVEALIRAAGQGRTQYYMPALICLGVEHGASRQKCLTLTWSDIKFDYAERGLIRFKRSKTNLERTEFLMPRSRDALLTWRRHLEYRRRKQGLRLPEDSELVFCRIDGTPLKRFDKAFRTACERAGIEDLHFHDLRHTFCSNLILSGAGLKDAKDMIGHADIGMTDRYSHLTADHKALLQQRLHEHYQNGGR